MIQEAKSKFLEIENKTMQIKERPCSECSKLKSKLDSLFEEKAKEETFNKYQSERILYLENKVSKLKIKYKNYKEKCKTIASNQTAENYTVIGSNTSVPTNKLNMCRTSSYSRFVGDLLEIVFGREVLGNSLLKGIKRPSKKTNILDPQIVSDIQVYVSTKFSIDQALVRSAIRRKLNIADRVLKEACNVDMNK